MTEQFGDFSNQNEEDLFADEEEGGTPKSSEAWKIVIVDDEIDIHQMTGVMLKGITFKDKNLKIFNAYSAENAQQVLKQYPDIALIFLDVVMESFDAGLKLVKHIRETLQNHFVRIILLTGQPGQAPEREVIRKYEINDYIHKAELTAQKVFTIVTANLRSYSDMMTIESYRQTLEEKVAQRTCELNEKNVELIDTNNQLKKLNDNLRKLDQAKNDILSLVVHDLKNPLAAIKSLADLIEKDYQRLTEEDLIEMTAMISSSSQRMFELINDLLDVNAIESGKRNISPSFIDIFSILQSLVKEYTIRAELKNIALHIQYNTTKKRCIIFIDQKAVRQVLENLISNAVKYSPHGKNINIRIFEDEYVMRCEIQDEGPGISDSDKLNLFEKFKPLSATPTSGEDSTGLGLYIVKKLVETMDGKVWYESELGLGTTFIVEFPK